MNGVGICSPGILATKFRTPKGEWEAIKSAIPADYNTGLITSDTARSPDLIKVIKENISRQRGAQASNVFI